MANLTAQGFAHIIARDSSRCRKGQGKGEESNHLLHFIVLMFLNYCAETVIFAAIS